MTTSSVRLQAHKHSHPWLVLAGFLAAVVVVAGVGGLGVSGTVDEYMSLRQPSWAPPSWLFGPAWTVLYGMIAVSGWLVWRQVGFSRPLVIWSVQLVLNAIWTPLFFGAGQYGLAFFEMVLLWLSIGATVFTFRKIRPLAAWLLVPYWMWVSFAACLNLAVWLMNR